MTKKKHCDWLLALGAICNDFIKFLAKCVSLFSICDCDKSETSAKHTEKLYFIV